jgi:hypothetical protein
VSLALGVFGPLGFSGRCDHHEAATGIAWRTGAAFIEDWLLSYARGGHLHCHLSGHLALFKLARGNSARAMAIYRDAIRQKVALSAPMLSLADSASFLWRWQVYGAAPVLADEWQEVAPPPAGISRGRAWLLPICMPHWLKRRPATTRLCRAALPGGRAWWARGGGRRGAGLCAAALALARADPGEASRILEAELADLPRIGGSHAQREVFEDTLIVADLRSRQLEKAVALLRASWRAGPRSATRNGCGNTRLTEQHSTNTASQLHAAASGAVHLIL